MIFPKNDEKLPCGVLCRGAEWTERPMAPPDAQGSCVSMVSSQAERTGEWRKPLANEKDQGLWDLPSLVRKVSWTQPKCKFLWGWAPYFLCWSVVTSVEWPLYDKEQDLQCLQLLLLECLLRSRPRPITCAQRERLFISSFQRQGTIEFLPFSAASQPALFVLSPLSWCRCIVFLRNVKPYTCTVWKFWKTQKWEGKLFTNLSLK